jgi:hypothetical protein
LFDSVAVVVSILVQIIGDANTQLAACPAAYANAELGYDHNILVKHTY